MAPLRVFCDSPLDPPYKEIALSEAVLVLDSGRQQELLDGGVEMASVISRLLLERKSEYE